MPMNRTTAADLPPFARNYVKLYKFWIYVAQAADPPTQQR